MSDDKKKSKAVTVSRQKKAAKPKGYRSKKHLKNPGGSPMHRATQERKDLVTLYAVGGVDQKIIADIIGICTKTLRKHYRAELDQSLDRANAEICGAVFKQAKAGCLKSQAMWMRKMSADAVRKVEHSGVIANMSLDTPQDPPKTAEDAAKRYKEIMSSLQP